MNMNSTKGINLIMDVNPMIRINSMIGMNPLIGMNPMMIMNNMQNDTIEDYNDWNLIFENKLYSKKIVKRISPDKTIQEAINIYKIKVGQENDEHDRFIYNGKILNYCLKISLSGLRNNAVITVVSFN